MKALLILPALSKFLPTNTVQKVGGNKGNVTLMSYDGRLKIQRNIAENISFDERLQAAKQLIDECLEEWTEGSRDEIKVIINNAFHVDKRETSALPKYSD